MTPGPLPDARGGPPAAVRLLRDRTVVRALRSYAQWVGRSVGWWTVAYLIFWLVVFAIAGVESVPRLDRPLAAPLVPLVASATTLLMLSPIASRRAPPVRLDRRDLIRLGLAPVTPWRVMRWPFLRAWLVRVLFGAGAGLTWTLVAGAWFHVSAPWAAPALAALAVAHLNLAWSVYAEADAPARDRRGTALSVAAALLALTGWTAPGLGLAAALLGPHATGLLAPAVVLGLSLLATRASLQEVYPPRFAPQSFVLGRLQALRTWETLSRLSGAGTSGDPGERARLLAILHDRPHALRPRRSLPLPNARGPRPLAVAWRVLQSAYRRPIAHQLGLLVLLVATFAAAGAAAGPFLSVQLPAFMLTWAASLLLPGGTYPATLPLRPLDRTLGRIAPGVGIALTTGLACLALAAVAGVAVPAPHAIVVLALVPTAFAVLEKVSSWAGGGTPEALVAAGVLTATPSFLANAFGVPELVLPGQILLSIIALLLPT